MPELELTETQKAYNVAQSEMFQLAAYGHHRYHPSGEALTDAGKTQQADYNDRISQARENLEAAVLRLAAEHAETHFSENWHVMAVWLRYLANDPGELSMLALRPDERADETFDDWRADSLTARIAATNEQPASTMPPCPNCDAKHIIMQLRRWPWRRDQWWRCYGCFTKFQAGAS